MAGLRIAVLVSILLPMVVAFSSGGGSGGDSGMQTCDALYLCTISDGAGGVQCPAGMTLVAPPVRSATYQLTTEDGTSSYASGELKSLTLAVTRKQIIGKADKGATNTSLESAKYIGLLLYAVRDGDSSEAKVGSWEVPVEEPPRFWLPPDAGGCAQQALMHATAVPKAYVERFLFRAPAGLGTLTFRALIKQGDTNAGAFYWPGTGAPPTAGVAGGDLTLTEAPAPPPVPTWRRAASDETCSQACAREALVCDEDALSVVNTSAALQGAVEHEQACRLPLLQACAAPSISTLADAFCWYPPAQCALPTTLCDAPPSPADKMRVRLCACATTARRLETIRGVNSALTVELLDSARGVEQEAVDEPKPTGSSARELATGSGCPSMAAAARLHRPSDAAHPCPTGARTLRAAAERERQSLRTVGGSPRNLLAVLFSIVALGAAATLTLWRQAHRQGNARQAAIGVLVLSEAASAHNWLNSPRSRTGKLSLTHPCPKRQRFQYPDIQVNRGQPFTVEWQVGHGRTYNFFILVAAEDEDKLATHTEKMMWEYLRSAPPNAAKFEGPYWDKYHVCLEGFDLCGLPGCPS